MEYGPVLTQENIKACISRIREEEAGRNSDHLIKGFLDLMTKLDIKIFETEAENNPTSNDTSKQYKVTISRKDKYIQTSFSICYPQPDLSDIFVAIRLILLELDDNYEEYCKSNGFSPDDPSNKIKYRKEIKTAKSLDRMFSLEELSCLPTTSSTNDDLDQSILTLHNISEYNKLNDLHDTVQYYKKLLAQYGYDAKKGEWDVRAFPVTQNDKQMDGIGYDVEQFNKAVEEYNQYFEYLAEKYGMDFNKVDDYGFIPT
jgi:hypothetical protein